MTLRPSSRGAHCVEAHSKRTADELSQIALMPVAPTRLLLPSKQTPLHGDYAIRVSSEMLKGNPPNRRETIAVRLAFAQSTVRVCR